METEQIEKTGRATYRMEDDKLRLYIGRVPRDEYLKLKAEGWVALHKQREAGQGDFAATWTPERRDTALSYADVIEDEDAGPAERAADRAERFSGYRDKRADEAGTVADKYESGPTAHGYQSEARAERAAARHDRQGTVAVDLWSKAEYWQRRTAGVISHALYKSSPGVRMGRIKTLEAELRKIQASIEASRKRFATWQKIAATTDAEEQTKLAQVMAGYEYGDYTHPVTGAETSLYRIAETEGVTGAQVAALWLSQHGEPATENDWTRHLMLRLAYENQMLAAQGGRLEQCEVLPGGKFCGKLILKVNKSSATGRATSVSVLGPRVEGWTYRASNFPGTDWAEHSFDLERYAPESYTPPTPESLAELAAVKKAIKAGAPVVEKCPLINPTDADAERLQAAWNAAALADLEARKARGSYAEPFKPSTVLRITQAAYSSHSKGAYASASTREVFAGAIECGSYYDASRKLREKHGAPVCMVRRTSGGNYQASRVIVLTDKPQKPLPSALWEASPVLETVNA